MSMASTFDETRSLLGWAFGFSDYWMVAYYLVILGGIPLAWFLEYWALSFILTGVFFGLVIGRITAIDSEG